jgi:energy-coupling factor transporter ATP-binding protein EcfA2
MWISELQVVNIKAFADSGVLRFSKGINIVVGKNNAGKSTLLQTVLCLQTSNQQYFSHPSEAKRIGAGESIVRIRLEEIDAAYFNTEGISDGATGDVRMVFTPDSLPKEFAYVPYIPEGTNIVAIPGVKQITNQEPNNFIFPYTVKRFAQYFNNLTSNNQTQQKYILESLSQLADKIQPFTQTSHLRHKQFEELCHSLLGSSMGIIEGGTGHLPGIYAGRIGRIPLSQMGDGMPHIVGLIVQLLNAEKKLFVIEELENSINPEPLKRLLEEIKRSAKEQGNQFLISTHSNIVLQALASEEDCTIIEVTQPQVSDGAIPTSVCTSIAKNDVEARRRVLLGLGYSLADSEMYDGWLILEESSAQTVIRKFLIPYFAPKLANILGIIATGGYNQAGNQFMTLYQNFLYLHLTPAYAQRVWVIVDAGEEERKELDRLRQKFLRWPSEHFSQFSEHDFERYYPACFQEEVQRILALPTKGNEAKKRQEQKTELLKRVLAWIDEDRDRAKKEFKVSAKTVIAKLKTIEKKLAPDTKAHEAPKRKRAVVEATVPTGQHQ